MYQEYPRHLHKAGGVYLVVNADDEKALALADGWLLAPPMPGADAAFPPTPIGDEPVLPQEVDPAPAPADPDAKAEAVAEAKRGKGK